MAELSEEERNAQNLTDLRVMTVYMLKRISDGIVVPEAIRVSVYNEAWLLKLL